MKHRKQAFMCVSLYLTNGMKIKPTWLIKTYWSEKHIPHSVKSEESRVNYSSDSNHVQDPCIMWH